MKPALKLQFKSYYIFVMMMSAELQAAQLNSVTTHCLGLRVGSSTDKLLSFRNAKVRRDCDPCQGKPKFS